MNRCKGLSNIIINNLLEQIDNDNTSEFEESRKGNIDMVKVFLEENLKNIYDIV